MGRASPELLDAARYPFSYDLQTRYADIDPQNHINNVAMAAAFEDARVRFEANSGLFPRYGGNGVVISAAHIDYLAQAYYPAPLTLLVGVIAIGRTSWTLGELAMQDGVPRAFCRAVMVCINDGRSAPLDGALRDWLEQGRLRPVAGE